MPDSPPGPDAWSATQTAPRPRPGCRPETGNIAAMLERAAADARTEELANAVSGLAEYWRFTGFTQPALIDAAAQLIARIRFRARPLYGGQWRCSRRASVACGASPRLGG
jgi:hypothetical protein